MAADQWKFIREVHWAESPIQISGISIERYNEMYARVNTGKLVFFSGEFIKEKGLPVDNKVILSNNSLLLDFYLPIQPPSTVIIVPFI